MLSLRPAGGLALALLDERNGRRIRQRTLPTPGSGSYSLETTTTGVRLVRSRVGTGGAVEHTWAPLRPRLPGLVGRWLPPLVGRGLDGNLGRPGQIVAIEGGLLVLPPFAHLRRFASVGGPPIDLGDTAQVALVGRRVWARVQPSYGTSHVRPLDGDDAPPVRPVDLGPGSMADFTVGRRNIWAVDTNDRAVVRVPLPR